MADANDPPDSLTGWLAYHHQEVGYGTLILGAVFLGLALFFGLKAFGSDSAPKKEDADKEKSALTEKDKKEDKADARVDRDEYFWPTIWAALVGGMAVCLGLWRLSRPEEPEWEPARARLLVLILGGSFGLLTALLGLLLAHQWRHSLLDCVNDGNGK